MRKLERQLLVLPHLLNSCPRHASKVTRVRTLANMLATAPLASNMFSEVDKLVRIYLTIPVITATGERCFSALRCIKTYLRSTMSQQHLNNIMLLNVCKDGLDLATIARQFVDSNERRRHFFGTVHSPQWSPPERLGSTLETVRLELFGKLTTCILLYYTILYYTILYYTILYYTILYYTILYYTILYYTILYYTILYYTILMTTVYDCRLHDCGWYHTCSD